ncbi:WGxxGxxG family protein [Paenibacillus silvisoli]|uniref:WGxxGxxG family protein n=1 Tax=Paenibacillus silvisoli TaxID=3110539 RepID=UPI0028042CED|nr:WGxxGxxG family protein [Paenibacillus silvisoli]
MKKAICSFAAVSCLTLMLGMGAANAAGTTTNGSTTNEGGMLGTGIRTQSTDQARTNTYNASSLNNGTALNNGGNYRATALADNDNDMDWGWLGLLGLIGLAGLRSRNREHGDAR